MPARPGRATSRRPAKPARGLGERSGAGRAACRRSQPRDRPAPPAGVGGKETEKERKEEEKTRGGGRKRGNPRFGVSLRQRMRESSCSSARTTPPGEAPAPPFAQPGRPGCPPPAPQPGFGPLPGAFFCCQLPAPPGSGAQPERSAAAPGGRSVGGRSVRPSPRPAPAASAAKPRLGKPPAAFGSAALGAHAAAPFSAYKSHGLVPLAPRRLSLPPISAPHTKEGGDDGLFCCCCSSSSLEGEREKLTTVIVVLFLRLYGYKSA